MSGFFFNNELSVFQKTEKGGLIFCNRDGFLIADFHTTLTSQTLFSVNRNRFAVLHLININGTNLHAFLASFTFIMIDYYFISHIMYPPYKYIKKNLINYI